MKQYSIYVSKVDKDTLDPIEDDYTSISYRIIMNEGDYDYLVYSAL